MPSFIHSLNCQHSNDSQSHVHNIFIYLSCSETINHRSRILTFWKILTTSREPGWEVVPLIYIDVFLTSKRVNKSRLSNFKFSKWCFQSVNTAITNASFAFIWIECIYICCVNINTILAGNMSCVKKGWRWCGNMFLNNFLHDKFFIAIVLHF